MTPKYYVDHSPYLYLTSMRRLLLNIISWLTRLSRHLREAVRRLLNLGMRIFDVFRWATGSSRAVKSSAAAAPDIFGAENDPAMLDALNRLARRAVIDIFDWLGLSHVPAQFWPILDQTRLPGESVAQFVEAIGCNVARVRAREVLEIERVQVIVDLLTQCNDLFAGMTDEQRSHLRDRVFVGDFDAVQKVASTLADLNFVLETGRRRTARTHFAAYARFLSEVEGYAKNPFSLSSADVEGAKYISKDYLASMRRFDALTAQFEGRVDSLDSWWPEDWFGTPLEDEFAQAESGFEDAQRGLLTEAGLKGNEVLMLLEAMEKYTEKIESLFDRAQAHTTAGATGAGKTGSGGQGTGSGGARGFAPHIEEALAFFKFPASFVPTSKLMKKAYWQFMKEFHPDRAKNEAERLRYEELSKDANVHYGNLKLEFPA